MFVKDHRNVEVANEDKFSVPMSIESLGMLSPRRVFADLGLFFLNNTADVRSD